MLQLCSTQRRGVPNAGRKDNDDDGVRGSRHQTNEYQKGQLAEERLVPQETFSSAPASSGRKEEQRDGHIRKEANKKEGEKKKAKRRQKEVNFQHLL